MDRGDRIPEFSLPDQNGRMLSSSDYRERWLVLYFYPKDNTSGCTKEAEDFSSLKDEFLGEGCDILGVSPDSVESHLRFREKHGLTITLLSDSEKTLLEAAGAWGMKKNYGKEYKGVIRTTILANPEGEVVEIWRNVKVRQKTKTCEILHARRVLEKLRELKSEG